MRTRWVACAVALALAGCGTPPPTQAREALGAAPGTTPPATDEDLSDGVDTRHGVHAGVAWTLESWLDEPPGGTPSLCLDLGWDDIADHWEACYPLSYAEDPLAWTNPTPPPLDGSRATFVVGLTLREAATVRAVRGDLVVAEGPVFSGGQLVADRVGFALPLDLGLRESIVEPAVLPVESPDVLIGVIEPLEIVALDAAGVEVARGFSPASTPMPMVCFFGPTPTPSPAWYCAPLFDELIPGFMIEDSVLWMTTPSAAVSVDLLLDGVLVASRSTAEVPLPAGMTTVAPRVAVFDIGDASPWRYEVVTRDAAGAVVTELDLATWFGGGSDDGDEGTIPGTR